MMKKLVIVTGSSNGIGRAIAEEFLKNDFSVVGIDRLDSTIENVNYHIIKKIFFMMNFQIFQIVKFLLIMRELKMKMILISI